MGALTTMYLQAADSGVDEIVDILNRKKGKGRANEGQRPQIRGASEGVSRISEVSKSKESSEYGSYNKKFSARPKGGSQEGDSMGRTGQRKNEEEYNPDYEMDEEERERIFRKLESEGQIEPEDLEYDVENKDYMRLVQRKEGEKAAGNHYDEAQNQLGRRKKTGKKGFQKPEVRPLYKAPQGPKGKKLGMKQTTTKTRPKTATVSQKGRKGGAQGLNHSPSKKHLRTGDQVAGANGSDEDLRAESEEYTPEMRDQISKEERRALEAKQGAESYDDDEEAIREEGYDYVQDPDQENAGDQHNIQEGEEEEAVPEGLDEEENMLYSILSKNIKHVRSTLRNLRENYVPDDEPKVIAPNI